MSLDSAGRCVVCATVPLLLSWSRYFSNSRQIRSPAAGAVLVLVSHCYIWFALIGQHSSIVCPLSPHALLVSILSVYCLYIANYNTHELSSYEPGLLNIQVHSLSVDQDTIYYKWASVKMTLKFHFLWPTLFWLEESVSAAYSDWLRGKSEANSCSWSVKTTLGITPSKSVLQDCTTWVFLYSLQW